GRAARQVVLLAPDLREGGQRVLHGRVGPLDLVRGELVVLLRAGLGEVDVLEPVGQRPAVRPADRERGDAGVVHRLRGGEEFVPGLGLVGARVLEDLGVVPDQRLVGGLVVDAVLLAVDRADVLPALRVVLGQLRLRLGAQRLGPLLLHRLLDGARLRQHRHVRRGAARDLRAEEVDDRVLGGDEGHLGAGALLELREDLLEVGLFGAGPHGGHLEARAVQLGEGDGGAGLLGAAALLVVAVVPASARGQRDREDTGRDGGRRPGGTAGAGGCRGVFGRLAYPDDPARPAHHCPVLRTRRTSCAVPCALVYRRGRGAARVR